LLQLRVRALLKGAATYLPIVQEYACRSSGGTTSARYCYTVWLRHLVKAHESQLNTNPSCVAELGPGDSLGVGIAALLSGANRYYALDAKPHAIPEVTLGVMDELVRFFQDRMDIPGDQEFPVTAPRLDSYAFPNSILTEARLQAALNPHRIDAIRGILRGIPTPATSVSIQYAAPWDNPSVIEEGKIDMALSQAVLEHVDDVQSTYKALRLWLGPRGFMSHSIDFKSHGLTRDWNGHWTVSDAVWKVVRGHRPYLLNRLPLSDHLREIEGAGFKVVKTIVREMEEIPQGRLARRFQNMTDADRSASGVFVQAVPRS
jgi:hypothetical protein